MSPHWDSMSVLHVPLEKVLVSVFDLQLVIFPSGLSVTDEILQGKAEWPKLFEPPNFFSKYK